MKNYFNHPFRINRWGIATCLFPILVPLAGAGELAPSRGQASSPAVTVANPVLTAAQIQRKQQMAETITRTTQTLQALQAAQASARALAAAGANNLGTNPNQPGQMLPNVPNGLVLGGLVPDSGLAQSGTANAVNTWLNAGTPVQTSSGGRTQVTVQQTAEQALLNWQSFNIGKNTTLTFDQSAGGANRNQWVAFNKINDPTGVPSQILGSIQAPGQVYVINQNGIIFGGTSQVNTHTLVASSLPINDNLLSRGLLNNPDQQFLFSQIPIPKISQGSMDAFIPPAPPAALNGKNGDVIVLAGAQLTSPSTADHVGGRIALVGPNVSNAGTISTPDGQTILAAGNQVALVGHDSNDPSLRGLDVFIGTVDATSGTAENPGLIDAPRANITLAGKAVLQNGFINSSTSVSLNGRVDLLANYNAQSYRDSVTSTFKLNPTASGNVSLGANSVTQILPELSSGDRVVGVKLALSSIFNAQGEVIHLGENSILRVPGAGLPADASKPALGTSGFALTAGINLNAGTWLPSSPGYAYINSTGQVYFDSNALIDAGGSFDISAPVSQNIVAVQLRGAELADQALQRFGALRGQTIFIDIRQLGVYDGRTWVGTPLADASGYVGLVERNSGELTTNGGSVSILAGGSVVMQEGSKIDVSGGWINYQEGVVKTSRVISGGRSIDISQATPDRIYDGLDDGSSTTHAKWGVTDEWGTGVASRGTLQKAYVFGADGGSISITAPSMALDGNLVGQTVKGPRQDVVLPQSASLNLSFLGQDPTTFQSISPHAPTIVWKSGVAQTPAAAFQLDAFGKPLPLSVERAQEVILSPDLINRNGFASLGLTNPDGDIILAAGEELQLAPYGSLTWKGANIDIEGSIVAPGGNLSFRADNVTLSAQNLAALDSSAFSSAPSPEAGRGTVKIGANARLDLSGLLIDQREAEGGVETLVTTGGTVTLTGYNVTLENGGVITVDGGALVDSKGKVSYGNAGSVTLLAGQDPNAAFAGVTGGKLRLGSTLSGYSGAKGGMLGIQAPAIQIGGSPADAETLRLNPEFFEQGGFSAFSLTGLGYVADGENVVPVLVVPGTIISPRIQKLGLETNPRGNISLVRFTPTEESLRSPFQLTLNAKGVRDSFGNGTLLSRGDLIFGAGASVSTDAKGSVTLKGQIVSLLGSITAPAGKIVIAGATSFPALNSGDLIVDPRITVYLGPDASLSTAGKLLAVTDARGYQIGSVLDGGNIEISGNIAAGKGSKLDVSGVSGTIDLLPAFGVGRGQLQPQPSLPNLVVSTLVESNGGSIVFKGSEALFTDSTLLGTAGGPSARGGSVSISSGRFAPAGTAPQTPLDVTLVVTQSSAAIPGPFSFSGLNPIGQSIRDENGNIIPGRGYFAADTFNGSGLDSLSLGGTVLFSGPVSLNASRSLIVGDGGVIYGDSAINLTASYVKLGQAFLGPLTLEEQALSPFVVGGQPFKIPPIYGTGELNATAGLIDVGNLSLQHIGRANLIADQGDVRGDGIFDVAGDILIKAGQVYPGTGVSFTIAAYDKNVVIASSAQGNSQVTLASAVLPQGFGIGSSLLGSTVQSINGKIVTLAGSANATISANTPGVFAPGSGTVTVQSAGQRNLPLSAGGQLNLYGATIHQGGVLRAPIGTIRLGWNGDGTGPADLLAGDTFNYARQVTLSAGSITSVSAVDPVTGLGIVIPYGTVMNGVSWIDPAGTDITTSGLPAKAVTISAANVDDQAGSVVDVRGGGDLYAYRFVKGLGGTTDILNSSSSYAVIPGYKANYAPMDPGYSNLTLTVGEQIYLEAGSGLAAGTYTLLPARYALLPGAYLVTPQTVVPSKSILKADGSSLVSGYRFNDLNQSQGNRPLNSAFEIAPASVLKNRVEYADSFANTFFRESALAKGSAIPRLPLDSGKLLLSATQTLVLKGTVSSQAPAGGRGSQIDISSPNDILIAGPGRTAGAGVLVLDSSSLSAFGADSLFIGGTRDNTSGGVVAQVKTNRLTVDNEGAALSGPEVILAANEELALLPGAEVMQRGSLKGAADALIMQGNLELKNSAGENSLTLAQGGAALLFPKGTPDSGLLTSTAAGFVTKSDGSKVAFNAGAALTLEAGSSITLEAAGTISLSGTGSVVPVVIGDGAVLRVSSDPAAVTTRTAVASSMAPQLKVGAGAKVSGTSVTLDSTYGTNLSPTAALSGQSVSLGSGQISIQLDGVGAVLGSPGLVLSGAALQNLQSSTQVLSLLSYSSIDIYGTGSMGNLTGNGQYSLDSLALHAGEIRGFNNGGAVNIMAKNILIDNGSGRVGAGIAAPQNGNLTFTSNLFTLGAGRVAVDQFAQVSIIASQGFMAKGSGAFSTQGNLTVRTPALAAEAGATQNLIAGGLLSVDRSVGPAVVSSGLGANLSLTGAAVRFASTVVLPSGSISLHAVSGDLEIADGGNLDTSGTSKKFYDSTRLTDGGAVVLISDAGNISLASGSRISVAASAQGGNSGSLTIRTPAGISDLQGSIQAGASQGNGGTFVMEAASLPGGKTAVLDALLNASGFNRSRDLRIRSGNVEVNGNAIVRDYTLSADQGSVTVSGKVDASGSTGGTIRIFAQGSLTLDSSAILTVAAENFDSSGKGGLIDLEAGNQHNGVIDPSARLLLASGALLDLSVTSNNSTSAALGRYTGTVHLRAPQTAGATDLQMGSLDATFRNASSIQVEGYKLFDLTPGSSSSATITTAVQDSVKNNGMDFGAASVAIRSRLLSHSAGLNSILVVSPGAELLNRTGDLVLGSTNSTSSADWDLSGYRFGAQAAPGILSLRAAGSLTLYNSISDSFVSSAYNSQLLSMSLFLPANTQSWAYRFAAGADLGASDFRKVMPLTSLAANSGHLNLGKNDGTNSSNSNGQTNVPGAAATTAKALLNRYQVIRTGTGDIEIATGNDIRFLNQFSTIYTAGVVLNDASVINPGDFDLPNTTTAASAQGNLGSLQQTPFFTPQYSLAGGNVSLVAGNDIIHLTQLPGQSSLSSDSSKEMPFNWLYRRGYVDVAGLFGVISRSGGTSDIGSTTWWVDFSNFFEGVGALGGGNVTLTAGRDVNNVDAAAPTNARMPGRDAAGNRTAPSEANLVELGGGDVTIQAGRNIDGGVYYVERGEGNLQAGNEIKTNVSRAPFAGALATSSPSNNPASPAPDTWLPTTLFLGKGSFDVSAREDVLLGPVANVFLQPQGINNSLWYKTYFSTYSPSSSVAVSSLAGDVTLKESSTNPGDTQAQPMLWQWLNNVSLLRTTSGVQSVSFYQPWLRLAETNVQIFKTVSALLPGTFEATSFSGDINLVGNMTLSPSPQGTVDFTASGSVNGLSLTGTAENVLSTPVYAASTVNLSDADPRRINGIAAPLAFRASLSNPNLASLNQSTPTTSISFISQINNLFAETGSTAGPAGVLQAKQALHDSTLLHAYDSEPVRIYALGGDISGLTLYSGKKSQVMAGRDISDIALYIQNLADDDVTIVSAGRDLTAYDPSSRLRSEASARALTRGKLAQLGNPLAGDIQINGPGTLEVLAGRNLDLGVGPNNADGTGLGITSIGNGRNPALGFAGADIVAGAGLGNSFGLDQGSFDFPAFIAQFVDTPAGAVYLDELGLTRESFNGLTAEQKNIEALNVFYLVLRESGRNHNDPFNPGFGNYDEGLAAIEALFPEGGNGNIALTSREIKTKNGGNISLLAPGGSLTVGFDAGGNQPLDQGILTESGGNISIFTKGSVIVGTSRIFTLRGGNIVIWSTSGDIAAGASSKTVQSAPPTRVLIDPQSADVVTDLSGLATGGGIGVLNTVAGLPPGNVDLVAPSGTVDAGDAGIRVSGNLNIAAVQVLNASNIQAGGTNAGGTVAGVAAPNISGLTAGSSATGATSSSANEMTRQAQNQVGGRQEMPSIITVEILGYGGDEEAGT